MWDQFAAPFAGADGVLDPVEANIAANQGKDCNHLKDAKKPVEEKPVA